MQVFYFVITCNKKLETLNIIFVHFENSRSSLPIDPNIDKDINGKRKEPPPGFERNLPLKRVAKELNDDKT